MSVLKYGIPNKERLVCANPICTDLATYIIHIENKKELFACTEHMHGLSKGHRLMELEKLKEPGERNGSPPPPAA